MKRKTKSAIYIPAIISKMRTVLSGLLLLISIGLSEWSYVFSRLWHYMKNLLVVPLYLTIFYSAFAHADFTGTIKQVVCHSTGVSPVCQIAVNGSATVAQCAANSTWPYTFDGTTAEGKNVLSILLAAQISKQTVTIGGKGTCSIPGTEDLRHVYITTAQ